MLAFLLYKIAQFLALSLPLKLGYRLAEAMADIFYLFSRQGRAIMKSNLRVVLGDDEEKVRHCAKQAFRNFGKYLIDFFRFSKLDTDYIERNISVEGKEYIDRALACGKGVIAVTAHLGNWELAGVVTSVLGYPINVIALSHKNRRVNDLFIRQRAIQDVKVIPLGIAGRRSLSCLAGNEIVALLGDRDFSDHGIEVEFFGKRAIMPKGPAIFNLKTGASIVPGFMIREGDDRFRLVFEKQIEYRLTGKMEDDLRGITLEFLKVIENYIKKYPNQWFMFYKLWYDC